MSDPGQAVQPGRRGRVRAGEEEIVDQPATPRAPRSSGLWLLADAAMVSPLAGIAEVLLLFLLSPDRPLTMGGFWATFGALLPQLLVAFVLLGPALAMLGSVLSVSRTTRRGISPRYILRFALLDAILLALAGTRQWFAVGHLLPGRAQLALALAVTSLGAVCAVLLVLFLADLRRDDRTRIPWLVALAFGLAIALTVSAQIRRVRFAGPPEPAPLPGFHAECRVLLIEMPGIDPRDLRYYLSTGVLPSVEELAGSGVIVPVARGDTVDPVSLHATLITGRPTPAHGVFGAVRYQPASDRRSFAILPRGLFLRPLLHTRLWRRIPVDHRSLRAPSLARITAALGVRETEIGDPLAGPEAGGDQRSIPALRLLPGARIRPPWLGETISCPDPGDLSGVLFDQESLPISRVRRYASLARRALGADLCALSLAQRALSEESTGWIHVRVSGYDEMAYQFVGFRPGRTARAVSQREVAALSHTLPRYLRLLEPAFASLLDTAHHGGEPMLIAFVSPLGVAPRSDAGRLLEALIGAEGPTGTHAGSHPGVLIIDRAGVKQGERIEQPVRLESVLPTLLWACGLPTAEDMGPVARHLFGKSFIESRPGYTVPSFQPAPTTSERR